MREVKDRLRNRRVLRRRKRHKKKFQKDRERLNKV